MGGVEGEEWRGKRRREGKGGGIREEKRKRGREGEEGKGGGGKVKE